MLNSWVGNYSYFRSRIDADRIVVVDVDDDHAYTFKDLDERANMLANVFREQFGILKGDRIAFISRNRIELLDAYYATGKLGAILVPYNARLSVNELTELIKRESPKVLFYEDVFEDKAKEIILNTSLKESIILKNGDNDSSVLDYEQLMSSASKAAVFPVDVQLEDTHMIIHTGGTTGLPKGALVSHRDELFNSFSEICTWGLSYLDKTLLLLPLFHTGGWNLLTLPLLHLGGRVYINRQFDPKTTLELIEKEKLTCLFGAATIFRMIANEAGFDNTDFSTLKWMMAGAAPTPKNIMKKYWDKGVKMVLGYGMTEAGPNNIAAPPYTMSQELVEKKYASVGKPMYFTMIKIVDAKGNQIMEPHKEGELLWSGPQIFSGYWKNAEETANTLVDGWVHTGDMATFDEDGFYYIVGRKKNMFISGGENVFPPEIEAQLYKIDAVRECCVIGVPDEQWGEVGKAIISLKADKQITKEEIIDCLSASLAKYKVPKHYQFVDDVPKNSVGKIVISEVIKQYGN